MWNGLEKNHLESKLIKAEMELAVLRERLRMRDRHTRRVEQAYEDALLLASWTMNEMHPSRDRAGRIAGIGQRRWENAVALLRMANVITRHRHWATNNQETIKAKLETAKIRAIEDPEAFAARHVLTRRR
jgi:hypothetical protein